MKYFISDTHFQHTNMLKFERTQFNTIEEHDDYIISKIKELNLTKNDELWHLGDFGYVSETVVNFWKSLKCKKVLIRGNHDTHKIDYLFDEIHEQPIYYNSRIILSHKPVPTPPSVFNVHGHLHNSYLTLPTHVNISIHVVDYKIFNERDIEAIYRGVPKDKEKFLYEWYAPYYHYIDESYTHNEDGTIKLDEARQKRYLTT